MDNHTHLLTLGTGPDREEIRLWEAAETLIDEHGTEYAEPSYFTGVWVLSYEHCSNTTWKLEAV